MLEMVPSLNPSPVSPCSSPTSLLSKSPRLPRCLTTLKHFGNKPNRKSLSFRTPGTNHHEDTAEGASRPRSAESLQVMWKRRGQTPGMGDYLTLEQLEDVWHAQDYYVGCVSAPSGATEYKYTEAVEAPLIAEHSPSARRQQTSWALTKRDHSPPAVPLHDSSYCVDNIVHPALRPVPYLRSSEPSTPDSAPFGRLAVEVPDTNWTYGRQ